MLILHLAKQLRNIRQLAPDALGSSGLGEKISHEPWGIRSLHAGSSRQHTFEGRRSAAALRAGANLTVRKMAKLFAARGD
ncbi:hypothetical protein [Mesorhizobium sp. ISC15]|uniref:hypothetical protein n=1 Tax=Mesorhizobium sp. ISC15 TaxID=3076429 RepID=UPI00301D304A